MADTTPIVASSEASSTPPSSASEQARIRKERREAKIRAGGSARLNKITGLGGGVQRDAPPQPSVSSHGDPEEVDISNHYYEPQRTQRPPGPSAGFPSGPGGQQISDDMLKQMMLGFDPATAGPPGGAAQGGMPPNPFASLMGGMGGMGPGDGADDPFMKMMQQMMGASPMPGMPGDAPPGMGGFPGMPGMGMGGMPGMPGQEVAADPYAYLWRILHAVFALGLGLYITLTATFSGSKFDRERSPLSYTEADRPISPSSLHFFWIFATVEVLLQSSRFFLEKGKSQQGGMIMNLLLNFLPEPYKGYVLWLSRYYRIWTTVSADAMVCVFVLGVCVWWKGNSF